LAASLDCGGLLYLRPGLGDWAFAPVPDWQRKRYADTVGGTIGRLIDLGAQGRLRPPLGHLERESGLGSAHLGASQRQRRMPIEYFRAQLVERGKGDCGIEFPFRRYARIQGGADRRAQLRQGGDVL
jgi:hypothetical protein